MESLATLAVKTLLANVAILLSAVPTDSPADLAAKKLGWEIESRKSVELRVATTITDYDAIRAGDTAIGTYDEHYIETAAGQRFCETRNSLAGKLTSRIEHFSDGSKFVDVNYDSKHPERQQMIFLKRQYSTEDRSDRKDLPQPLLYLFVGRTPLHEALPKAEYLGAGKVLERECDAFLFKAVRWPRVQDQVFHLDRATAIPLKVEAFQDQAARENKKPMWRWVAKSLDRVQGHYIPLKSMTTAIGNDGAPRMTWDFRVELMRFDLEYPASTFRPTMQPGVTIVNGLTDKVSKAPGEVKTTDDAKAAAAQTTTPVRAVPPGDWTTSVSMGSLALGSIILLSGSALWWQRS